MIRLPRRSLALIAAHVLLAGCRGSTGSMAPPGYTSQGELVRPEGYLRWVLAGASIGLGYSEGAPSRTGPGLFHNVYLHPEAYDRYSRTGKFPEGTMLVLALFDPRQGESIAREGYFEGDLAAVEVAVKDSARFPGGWAYFDFGRGGSLQSAKAISEERCFRCHKDHAADDNVFVQFYPALRAVKGKAAGPGKD